MNKFNDMISLLTSQISNFRLLVAMDINFNTLSRVWCVAEIYQACVLNIPLSVCIESNGVFEANAEAIDIEVMTKLMALSVADCEASREEDKADILGRITDIASFDVQLQHVIFGQHGIFHKKFTAYDALVAAGNSARRTCALSEAYSRRSTGSNLEL
eukprot:TRINITY_DN15678_c0_g1_i1.p1 TRINITY_DN15678_c0_g1~~TRINITY_DN15678_c0_g1_i1.p1  ORF type:complete len:158 (-),score=21.34 TRINITY_DN15678_c0_g1_i1:53-526(-)